MLNSNFPKSARITLLLVVSLLICPMAFSQQGYSPAERDHPLLERFAGSTIVEYGSESDVNYRLILGNMRRSAGRVVAEQSERLTGDLTRITYEIPQGFAGAEVGSFYQQQARENGYTELFNCSGRDCGNSNYWANEVFDNRSLYGPERNQYYLVFRIDSDQSPPSYAAVYVTTRTNRRQFAHVELLDSDGGGDDFVAALSIEKIFENGAIIIPELVFDDQDRLTDAGGINQIATQLQANESIDLYVVGHLQDQGLLDNLIARSLRRAERTRDLLIERGVDASRLTARGVGPLAPLCSENDCAERVELVVRPPD
ncbi:MAG: DUF4892 domain-containing protein [Gammaproteobacteria bacterium]|nr:DUF4892 domain-containing protein [Gammaproteobacteria bacterium]